VHNLKGVSVDVPRNAIVVFSGVSGSGKSSLAFSTIYAEAERRYLDALSPHARRLLEQLPAPDVDSIEGLPPAIALKQRRGATSARSTVGSVTALSNLLRLLYSRHGCYPCDVPRMDAEAFSPDNMIGACSDCHGLGLQYDVAEHLLVPDDSLSIRNKAIAAWPPAWHGQNLREILVSLGHDIDKPWRDLPRDLRDWILYTEDQPTVRVYPGLLPSEVQKALIERRPGSYKGTFVGVRRYVLNAFATTESPAVRKRVSKYLLSTMCNGCRGKRLNEAALRVKIAGRDIAQMLELPIDELIGVIKCIEESPISKQIKRDILSRAQAMAQLGLGYLSPSRSSTTLSIGELQRVRLAAQLQSNLHGVAYVLDEPSAGLHPSETEILWSVLNDLKHRGNSVLIVEHDLSLIRRADWIVDVGPDAGLNGGSIVHSGPVDQMKYAEKSHTAYHLFAAKPARPSRLRPLKHWISLTGVGINNVVEQDTQIPLYALTTVTGVSGSGKTSLFATALTGLVSEALALKGNSRGKSTSKLKSYLFDGAKVDGLDEVNRLIVVDQNPIGRTPRSNIATYTGLFDRIRQLFAMTESAKARGYSASRFSFNVAAGRCQHCEGEGFIEIELLFLPAAYAPCPQCQGSRYNDATLEIRYLGLNIAETLALTVGDAAKHFFADNSAQQVLQSLLKVGLDYLKLGQPATELSGGEAQRIKLATELQRTGPQGALFILDEPTTGMHPSDSARLLDHLVELVDRGNTVVAIEHDMSIAAASDWVIDMGPGGGRAGGRIVTFGRPREVSQHSRSRTSAYLACEFESFA
jgi:excinuclease ABC subunit A